MFRPVCVPAYGIIPFPENEQRDFFRIDAIADKNPFRRNTVGKEQPDPAAFNKPGPSSEKAAGYLKFKIIERKYCSGTELFRNFRTGTAGLPVQIKNREVIRRTGSQKFPAHPVFGNVNACCFRNTSEGNELFCQGILCGIICQTVADDKKPAFR